MVLNTHYPKFMDVNLQAEIARQNKALWVEFLDSKDSKILS
jgi:hypothetical protein